MLTPRSLRSPRARIASGAILVFGFVVAAAPARAGVIVVEGEAAVLFDAIDAAAEGDILLIKPGSSGGFLDSLTIDGKSLTLVVDGGTYTLGQLSVRNLAAGQQVTLRNLTLGPTLTPFSPIGSDSAALNVVDCAGAVWVDTCTLAPPPTTPGLFGFSPHGLHGLTALNSQDVVVSDCTITGGHGTNESGSCGLPGYAASSPGGDGVHAKDS